MSTSGAAPGANPGSACPYAVLGLALVTDQLGKGARMVFRYPTSPPPAPDPASASTTNNASATNLQESKAELKKALSKESRKCQKFSRQTGRRSANSCRRACHGLAETVGKERSSCDTGGSLFGRGCC